MDYTISQGNLGVNMTFDCKKYAILDNAIFR